MPKTLTPEIALAAIAGLELQKTQIDSQIADLRSIVNGGRSEPAAMPSESGQGKRKKFSLASRRKMAAAQRARYARLRGESEPSEAETTKPKRKLTAAARKRIGAAVRKRWALKKAGANKAA